MAETEYTLEQIEQKAEHFGEFMVVLESDREYDFHNFTVTTGPTEGDRLPPLATNEFRIEGLHDGEHLVVDIPVGRVEHVYAHRAL
jgi:hypothetical protein